MRGTVFVTTLMFAVMPVISAQAQDERRITVMSYNVENLFDTEDNPSREGDNTYLPISQKNSPEHVALCERNNDPGRNRTECLKLDWNEKVLAAKIRNLATVIGRFEGRGPDILVLQEVENREILDRLRLALPDAASFRTVINRDDSPGRGINVAFISRLQVDESEPPISISIQFPSDVTHVDGSPCSSTRNLTGYTLKLPDGAPLTIFSVHMPAGGNAHACRRHVAGRLVEILNGLPASRMVIVAGDTNLNCGKEDQQTISKVLRSALFVPDEVNKGCRAPGSSFFPPDGSWSFLDLIMPNRRLLGSDKGGASWFAELGTFRTVITAPDIQIQVDKQNRIAPRAFDPEELTGATDHWPVALDLFRRR